ncbi:MAG: stage sporulation protein, partial [Bacillota bacterium]|nr:stage sporulation protein [Bacillota bacterium]
LFVVTFPITLILFIVKGISMGYTINSVILAMKLKSIKFILITTFKNLIIILGTIILILISINYIKEMVLEFKKSRNRSKIIFLFSRYLLNSIIVLAITIGLQVLLNTLIISIIKFLVR